jgi:hypothetical protein
VTLDNDKAPEEPVGELDLASSGPFFAWLHPAVSTIKQTSPASPSLPDKKIARSRADDGIPRQTPSTVILNRFAGESHGLLAAKRRRKRKRCVPHTQYHPSIRWRCSNACVLNGDLNAEGLVPNLWDGVFLCCPVEQSIHSMLYLPGLMVAVNSLSGLGW